MVVLLSFSEPIWYGRRQSLSPKTYGRNDDAAHGGLPANPHGGPYAAFLLSQLCPPCQRALLRWQSRHPCLKSQRIGNCCPQRAADLTQDMGLLFINDIILFLCINFHHVSSLLLFY